ncbi:MAG: Na/Pi cotransporter family protein [Treponema sp.]|jgi:phosphate:Na+ symporter|nr:Na/Pi cotransporter family protein [Treponema sp.]
MAIVAMLLRMAGGLCMFLFGMKLMSDGMQQSAGDRMKKALNFMTGNRFVGMLTGFVITAVIQSSSAASVIIVSFVNAGLLTLTQSIGVIFGVNIGTTLTTWIVAFLGFSIDISSWALPAIGIGFILRSVKWKYQSIGELMLGFGFLFLGLEFLTQGFDPVRNDFDITVIAKWADWGVLSVLIGFTVGLVGTAIINSSTASIAIIMTMAYNGMVGYEMAAGFILGANVGTTTNVALAAIGARTAAKRSALVHILFNVIGACWALPLLRPLLALVDLVTPGTVTGGVHDIAITTHIAMIHTIYNLTNAALFLPFVKQFAKLVSFIVPDKSEEEAVHYKFDSISGGITNTPEFSILRAEKEIRDMAGIVSSMYSRFTAALRSLREGGKKHSENTAALCTELEQKEAYIDEMREALSGFLIECTRVRLNAQSEIRISYLLRVIANIEEMSDECYSLSRLLEKSVRKNNVFADKEMDDLIPYVGQVEEFLGLLQKHLSQRPTAEQTAHVVEIEARIDKDRKKLQKLSRKRIEAGKDVRTELLFIDLVRRIEKLGDYCFEIAEPYKR